MFAICATFIAPVSVFMLRTSDEMLEPYDGKLSRTVLRREGGGNTADPADYSPLVEALGGQVIHISSTSKDYINPMDINLNYADDDNPLGMKSDFILSLCELIMGARDGMEPEEKSVIDRCLPLVYQKYLNDPKPENMPTLGDLYDCLREQKERQAQRIATALEIYVNGSLRVFNHQTNVELDNRIICFDIKELGKQLKKLGMLIVQDQVWNRVTINRNAKKNTRYYVDEFHLLLKEEQTAAYSVEIWKRFRKWGGVPTGITQNIKDLLASREIENIFENSDFIYMLNQASGDRQILAKQLNISPFQLSYVTNSNEGEGHIGTWYAVDETEIGGEKFFLLEHEEHGDMAACVAVNEQGKLVAEDLWNGFDEDFQEAVQKYLSEKWNMPKKEDVVSEIIEKAAPVPDNSAQDFSDVPVYYEPFSYAKENDEVDLYRTSYRLNSECKQAIHEAIADNYDGMYLGDDAVDQVVRQYGMERVGYILANTLHHKSYDGRFSHSNKEWAEQVSTPEHNAERMTFRTDWVVDSHPAVLDGFVTMYRDELEAQKKLEQEQPFVKQFYVIENLQAAPLKIERFGNLDDAMSQYQALPNHCMKEIRALTKQASEKTYIGGLTKECVDAFVSMVYLYDDQTMKIEFNCEDVIRRALEKYGA